MKIFKHEGRGFYIGSCIVVKCEDIKEAEFLIRKELDEHGLSKEKLEVEECTGKIIVSQNGDY